jgi:hypothetical protein
MQRAKDVHQVLLHLHARQHRLLLLLAMTAAAAANGACYKSCMLCTINQRPVAAAGTYHAGTRRHQQMRQDDYK